MPNPKNNIPCVLKYQVFDDNNTIGILVNLENDKVIQQWHSSSLAWLREDIMRHHSDDCVIEREERVDFNAKP
jgi:hypothetical protein